MNITGDVKSIDSPLPDRGAVLSRGSLSGIRVLDLADQKGIYCTKLLADLGADVIRVEPPGGDPLRNLGPFLHDDPHPEKSLYCFQFNANKRSVTLDLDAPEGLYAFQRLAGKADVLVETFQPGYLEKRGLGYEDLKGINPGLIMTSITGFGQAGPWRNYKSCDIVALATGGVLHECGWADRPPLRMAGSQAYYMGSVQGAVGTLMALYYRLNTGKGQQVDVSLQQSVPVCMQVSTMIYSKTGKIREREGSRRKQPAQGIFSCRDGYIDIGQLSAFSWWDRFVEWLDGEKAAADLKEEKWHDPFYRTQPEAIAHVNEVLGAFFAERTKEEIFHRGQRNGVVIGAVNTPEDIANDIQLKERRFFVPVTHPDLGLTLQYLGPPYRLSETPWRIAGRAPYSGEHNREVLGEGTDSAREEPLGTKPAAVSEDHPTRLPTGEVQQDKLPLRGIRVIEFTEQIAGPMAGKALADFGAQVILVENEERVRKGSSSRHPGTGAGDLTSLNLGNHFNKFNTNKLSVTLNLKQPKGREIAGQLIGKSDVVISNFRPQVLERWGFTYPALKMIKSDIIFVTIPAFGIDGPYRDYRTLSWNLMAMCGMDYAGGFPDRPPVRASPHSYPDTSSQPFHTLVAILAALYWRASTGKGQHIEVCQYESSLCFTETLVFDYLVNLRIAKPLGNRLDYAAPHGVYRCKGNDQWCALGVFNDEEWQSFCQAINRTDLIRDIDFASLKERVKNADRLDKIINEWTGERSSWVVMEVMQEAGIAAGVVENVEDLLVRDPQLKARNHWIDIDHPEAGKMINEDWGFRLSAIAPLQWRHAPLLGEHSDFVLTEVLGMTEPEINQLIIEGVVA